jgi:hypothetical protein
MLKNPRAAKGILNTPAFNNATDAAPVQFIFLPPNNLNKP